MWRSTLVASSSLREAPERLIATATESLGGLTTEPVIQWRLPDVYSPNTFEVRVCHRLTIIPYITTLAILCSMLTALDLPMRWILLGLIHRNLQPQISQYIPHRLWKTLLCIPGAVAKILGRLNLESVAMTDMI